MYHVHVSTSAHLKLRQKRAAVEVRLAGTAVRDVCTMFGISRSTLCRWVGLYDVDKPGGGLQRKRRAVLLRCPNCSTKSPKSALQRIPHTKKAYPPEFQWSSCGKRARLRAFRSTRRGVNTTYLIAVADLASQHPRWGRRRLWVAAVALGFRQSESTAGRMLAVVNKRCPSCGAADGRHAMGLHALKRDLRRFNR